MKQINFSSYHASFLSMVVWFLSYGWYSLYGSGTNTLEILAIKISKIRLLQTLISPKIVSHRIINNYHFLKMHKDVLDVCMYIALIDLGFLAHGSTKLQKMHCFRQFKDHNSWWKHGSKASDPIFSSNFYVLFLKFILVCKIHFLTKN